MMVGSCGGTQPLVDDARTKYYNESGNARIVEVNKGYQTNILLCTQYNKVVEPHNSTYKEFLKGHLNFIF